MSTDNLLEMKQKAHMAGKVVSFIYFALIIVFVALICFNIYLSFFPADAFSGEDIGQGGRLSVELGDGAFFVETSFPILSFLPEFHGKTAFFTFFLSSTIIYFATLIFGVYQVRAILQSTVKDHSPFKHENVQRLRNLAYVVIAYSLLGRAVINVLYYVSVLGFFSLHLWNISLTGAMIGVIILVFSQIIKYGVYLQAEHDTTL